MNQINLKTVLTVLMEPSRMNQTTPLLNASPTMESPKTVKKGLLTRIGLIDVLAITAIATMLTTTKVEGFTLGGLTVFFGGGRCILRHLETNGITLREPIPAGYYPVASKIAEKEAGANPSEKYRTSFGE